MKVLRQFTLKRCRQLPLGSQISHEQQLTVHSLVKQFDRGQFFNLLVSENRALLTYCDLHYALHYTEMLQNFGELDSLTALQCVHLAFRELNLFQEKCLIDGGLVSTAISELVSASPTVASADADIYKLRIGANYAIDNPEFSTQLILQVDFLKFFEIQALEQPATYCLSASLIEAQFQLIGENELLQVLQRITRSILRILSLFSAINAEYMSRRLFPALRRVVFELEEALPGFVLNETVVEMVHALFVEDSAGVFDQYTDLWCYCLWQLQLYDDSLLRRITHIGMWRFLGQFYCKYVKHLPRSFFLFVPTILDSLYELSGQYESAVSDASPILIAQLDQRDVINFHIQRLELCEEDFWEVPGFVERYELFEQ